MIQSSVKFLFDFLVMTVLLKLVVAHYLAEHVFEPRLLALFQRTESRAAILEHYVAHAFKKGHVPGSIVTCQHNKCSGIR